MGRPDAEYEGGSGGSSVVVAATTEVAATSKGSILTNMFGVDPWTSDAVDTNRSSKRYVRNLSI